MAVKFTVEAGGMLGATQLSALEQFLYGKLLTPVVQGHQGGVTVALPPSLHVRIVDDDWG